MFPKLEEGEATKTSPEPQSMSLSRILLPLLQQVEWNGSVHINTYLVARKIHFPPPTHTPSQYDPHSEGDEGKGVSSIEELGQSFKIAERSSPGFCDELVQKLVVRLKR